MAQAICSFWFKRTSASALARNARSSLELQKTILRKHGVTRDSLYGFSNQTAKTRKRSNTHPNKSDSNMVALEELLQPVTEAMPCGEDLSYDANFQALETMIRGTPETQFSDAKPPEWKPVRSGCLDLLARSKDLRVALILMVAELELDGIAGFKESLAFFKALLERYWLDLHPQLDPAENNDPLQRMNLIATIAMPIGSFGDDFRILERLRAAPLCDSVQMGSYSLSDILNAETGSAEDGKSTPDLAQIEAAFRDSKPEQLILLYQSINESIDSIQKIDVLLTNTVGAKNAPDLTRLSTELVAIQKRIKAYVPVTRTPLSPEETPVLTENLSHSGTPPLPVGGIGSRDDVIRTLQRICQYYAQAEPSSPVPLILRRALRLAEMDFVQIIKEMAPEAIGEIYRIAGEKEE
jgi:type VI secretion system protein ImpA